MSTVLDLRDHNRASPARRLGAPAAGTARNGRARPGSGRRTRKVLSFAGAPIVWRLPVVPLVSLRTWRPRGAGLVALVIAALSLLGLIYLLQISRVARYGYTLSRLEQQQAKLDRENELLVYQVSQERGLARVDDLARREYGMQPFEPGKTPEAAPVRSQPTAAAKARPTMRYRFLSVPRPPGPEPAPAHDRAPRTLLIDRLWQRIVGIGVAKGP